MDKQSGQQVKDVLKTIANILVVLAVSATIMVFALLALAYKSLPFFYEYYTFLVWATVSVVTLAALAYIVLYLLKKTSWYRLIFLCQIFLLIFAIIFYVVCRTELIKKINSIDELRDYISSFGSLAVILFIVFSFLQVVILPVPGSVSIAAGVALFGPFLSAVYSFIGIVIGSLVAFFIGRVFGYKVVCWIVGKEDLEKWLNKVKGKDYLILSLMFLLPLFPDDVLCFIAGLSSMTWGYFIVMIVITRAISVLYTAYSLNFIPFNTWWGILIWIALAAIVVVLFWLVCKYSDKIDAAIKKKFKIKGRKQKNIVKDESKSGKHE
jgi:uncharacterized membrane protein YdjX (TVP38/TMEM64 family)